MGISAGEAGSSSYTPVSVGVIRVDSILNFDMYLYRRPSEGAPGKYVLYRKHDLPISSDQLERLADAGVETVFVKTADRKAFTRYVESNLDQILEDGDLDESEKVGVVYETAADIVDDVMKEPAKPENLQRGANLVQQMIRSMSASDGCIEHFLTRMSGTYLLYTHSVNVSLYSLALANRLGMEVDEAKTLGVATLLHDVGKTRVDRKILEKPSALTAEEVQIVRMHPEWGLQVLKDADLPEAILSVVHEHHERYDGSGYPQGLVNGEIHPFARIACIMDIFDALTTKHYYRPAYSVFDALKIMRDDYPGAFEHELWRQFVLMLGEDE